MLTSKFLFLIPESPHKENVSDSLKKKCLLAWLGRSAQELQEAASQVSLLLVL